MTLPEQAFREGQRVLANGFPARFIRQHPCYADCSLVALDDEPGETGIQTVLIEAGQPRPLPSPTA